MTENIKTCLSNLDLAVSSMTLKRVEHDELRNNLNTLAEYITKLEANQIEEIKEETK